MIDARQQVRLTEALIDKRVEGEPDAPHTVDVSSSYAGGNPTAKGPGNSSASSETLRVLAPATWDYIDPSDRGLAVPTGADAVYGGSYVDMPIGIRNSQIPWMLPKELLTVTSVGIGTADQVRMYRVYVGTPILVASLVFRVTTNNNPSNVSFAFFSSDGPQKIIDTGAISAATTGTKTHTLGSATQLYPGYYRVAWTCDNTTVRLAGFTLPADYTAILNSGTLHFGRATNGSSAGVMPSTTGAFVDVSLTTFPCLKAQQA